LLKNKLKKIINKEVFKKLMGIIFLVAVFLSGFLLVLWYRVKTVEKYRQTSFKVKESNFELEPPKDSLVGRIATSSGKVVKEKRDEDEFKEINIDEEIIKGEALATFEDSGLVVDFENFANIEVDENTEIELISTDPENFLINFKKGSFGLEIFEDDEEVSVRALNALISFEKGKGEISVNNDLIYVDVIEGLARAGIVDLDNNTEVYEIEEGQSARINNLYRRVEIY